MLWQVLTGFLRLFFMKFKFLPLNQQNKLELNTRKTMNVEMFHHSFVTHCILALFSLVFFQRFLAFSEIFARENNFAISEGYSKVGPCIFVSPSNGLYKTQKWICNFAWAKERAHFFVFFLLVFEEVRFLSFT